MNKNTIEHVVAFKIWLCYDELAKPLWKKDDWILAAAIFFVAVLTFGLQLLKTTDEYSEVEIQVNGELYGRYRLEQDQEIDVNDKNKVLIKDRKVRMEDADCPDQICVNHRAISRDGESIICLPNQTIVTIRGGEEPEVDEIAR